MNDMKAIETKKDWGFIDGDYFKYDAISRSRLKECLKSLAHFRDYQSMKATTYMNTGSAIHCKNFEPHLFDKEFLLFEKPFPENNMNKKENKEAWAQAQDSGKIILTPEQMEKVEGMHNAILNPQSKVARTAKMLLFDTEGDNEKGIWWMHECGEKCKIKGDRIITSTKKIIPIDYKKTQDASPKGFEKACVKYDYPLQDVFYSQGIKKAYGHLGKEIAPMHFIMQEEHAPYRVGIYTIHDADKYEINEWINHQLCEIAYARKENDWTEYENPYTSSGIHSGDNFAIQLPAYYTNKYKI